MNCLLLHSQAIHASTACVDEPKMVTHIKTVLKSQVGDTLKIGVLGGALGRAVVAGIDDCVWLEKVQLDTPPPPKLPLTVVLAMPRPKVLRRLIMDMSAAGVAKIVLLHSYRSDKSYWHSPLLSRIDEFVLEGLMQGVDTIAPNIVMARRFRPFVEDELAKLGAPIAVLHPYDSVPFGQSLQSQRPQVIVIGAEGGFVPYELQLLQAQDAQFVAMGERILRTEAAVNAALGAYLAHAHKPNPATTA